VSAKPRKSRESRKSIEAKPSSAGSAGALVARLQVQHSLSRGESFDLREGESLRVGRFDGNEIVLHDANASRFHAVFNAGEGALFLTDLASLNGTYVNEKRIGAPVRLGHGDRVRITDWEFLVALENLGDDTQPRGTRPGATRTLDMRAIFVTALVADINQYTKMAERLRLSELTQMLDRWVDFVGDVVKAHGGIIDSTHGDSVLALWLPGKAKAGREELGKGALSALHAAKEIIAGTLELAALDQWPHEEAFPWHCKVSLHSGEALEGVVGGSEHRQHSIIGDAINVAFRLNDLCHAFGKTMLTTGVTQQLVGAGFPLQELGTVVLEGRDEAVVVWG
jgi:class 3 adenylate cyclase